MSDRLKKLKEIKKKRDRAIATDRFQNIAYFFNQKGLLVFANKPRVIRGKNIDINDILWAAKFEPRIIEVFPAALIHFKKKFTNTEKIPKKLNLIIELIKKDEHLGPDFEAIKYSDMKRWANIKLKDKRTKPLENQKKLYSYKFDTHINEKLEDLAHKLNLTKTEVLEKLIQSA